MGLTRRRLSLALLTLAGVATVVISFVRGTAVTETPFEPTTPAEGVRCEIVAWPSGAEGEKGVRCAGVFDQPIAPMWAALTDYTALPDAFDNIFYDFQADALTGNAPGAVALKGRVQFWLMRFPFDMTLTHEVGHTARTVGWRSDVPRFSTRGGWRLEPLSATRTRVEYLIDARIALLPDFVVRVVLRDNLPRVLRTLETAGE